MGLKLSALSTLYMGLSFWNPRATDIWIWWWSIDVKTLDSRPRPRPNFLVYETLFSSLFTCEFLFFVTSMWVFVDTIFYHCARSIYFGYLLECLCSAWMYTKQILYVFRLQINHAVLQIIYLHFNRKPIFHSNLKENKTENLYFNT